MQETKLNPQQARRTRRTELQKRIRTIQEWLLQDQTTPDIINQIVLTWTLSDRQAYRYLWAARRFFIEKNAKTLEEKKAFYLERKRKLLRGMNEEEKKTAAGVTAANKVLDSMAKMEGVSVETLKLIGDASQPVKVEAQVAYSSPNIDYSQLPTEFLELILQNRRTA